MYILNKRFFRLPTQLTTFLETNRMTLESAKGIEVIKERIV